MRSIPRVVTSSWISAGVPTTRGLTIDSPIRRGSSSMKPTIWYGKSRCASTCRATVRAVSSVPMISIRSPKDCSVATRLKTRRHSEHAEEEHASGWQEGAIRNGKTRQHQVEQRDENGRRADGLQHPDEDFAARAHDRQVVKVVVVEAEETKHRHDGPFARRRDQIVGQAGTCARQMPSIRKSPAARR